jgi:ferredoxin-NADP reductase
MDYNLTYSGKIVNINIITADSKFFLLQLEHFPENYTPGQYLVLSHQNNNKEYRRSYSIVTYHPERKELGIIVKRIENGMVSRALIDYAKIGDTVEIVAINGFFTLPHDIHQYKQVFFIAAGSGIAPIYPMIQSLMDADIRINLLYSSKNGDKTILYNELNELQEKNSNLKIDYLFSESENVQNARLNNTLLTTYIHKMAIAQFDQVLFYTCGPLDYMDTVSITLLTEGVPKNNIKKELYYNNEQEVLSAPEDTNPYQVTISFPNGNAHTLQVQYPNSILNTALDKNIPMPYSCGSGQCGSCTAKILSGKVWMAYNEVITDRELSQGYVLTCLGFPIEGDVVLEF